jgi:hypothetical protein
MFIGCSSQSTPVKNAGSQQLFFATAVQKATRVRISKIGPDKTPEGAMFHHILLDSTEAKVITEVATLIEIIDPAPAKVENGDKIWKSSLLSFGVAEYILEFFNGDTVTVKYAMDKSMNFLAPVGDHAPQPIDVWLDYPLTDRSSILLKSFVHNLK